MHKFESHFRMSAADAAEYAAWRLPIFAGLRGLECSEIGDGNINYVFKVRDPSSGKSVIIKHADEGTRSSQRQIGLDRNRIEAEILQLEGRLAPGLVPEVYDYDPVMRCLSMEDLSDHALLRYELVAHRKFPRLAEDLTDFMVKTLVPTMDAVMDAGEKKEAVKRYTNPALCQITEQLVYTEPFLDTRGKNKVFPPNADFVQREIYSDRELHLEAAKLKYSFMNNAQALIHGDLHTGSVFVRADSTKVFDPEFAFYGPIGYDVGNVIGNLCFAWANAQVTIVDEGERRDYVGWLDHTIAAVTDLFAAKFLQELVRSATDPMARLSGYAEWLTASVLADSAGVAGLEMLRRTVGVAQVRDLVSIADPVARTRAERIVIFAAKRFIKGREDYRSGDAYTRALYEIAGAVEA